MVLLLIFQPMTAQLSFESWAAIAWKVDNSIKSMMFTLATGHCLIFVWWLLMWLLIGNFWYPLANSQTGQISAKLIRLLTAGFCWGDLICMCFLGNWCLSLGWIVGRVAILGTCKYILLMNMSVILILIFWLFFYKKLIIRLCFFWHG